MVTTKLLEGSHSSTLIAYSIVKFAEDENIDLISVGKIGQEESFKQVIRQCGQKNI